MPPKKKTKTVWRNCFAARHFSHFPGGFTITGQKQPSIASTGLLRFCLEPVSPFALPAQITNDGKSAEELLDDGTGFTYNDILLLPGYIDFPADAVETSCNFTKFAFNPGIHRLLNLHSSISQENPPQDPFREFPNGHRHRGTNGHQHGIAWRHWDHSQQ